MSILPDSAPAQLLRVALLGTRQSGEAVPTLPGMNTDLPEDADAREKLLLLTSGALALAQKAGFQAVAAPLLPAPAPTEAWQPLGRRGAECIRALLDDNRYHGLLADYLSQLRAHRRLIPSALLVPVLHHKTFRSLLAGDLTNILGERGRWLARQNPEWQALAIDTEAPADPAIWETGTPAQRRAHLRQLHQTDPAQARELLAAALPAEPASQQAALLSELASGLTAADAPLLEPYLTAKSKEVRQTAAQLLARLPQSVLLQRLWQRARPLLAVQAPAAGPGKLLVTLPEAWDKSWLADGVEQRDASFEGGEKAGQLGQLLALLPPSRWTAHLQLTPDELLTLAESSDWAALLLRAWTRAAILHQDKAFAAPLLLRHLEKARLSQAQAAQLAGLLTDAEKLELLRSQLPYQAGALLSFLPELLAFIGPPWPADVVAAALRYLTEVMAGQVGNRYGEPYQRCSLLLYHLGGAVAPAQTGLCTELLAPLATTSFYLAPLIADFFDTLQFRQKLTASLSEP
ncbi:DUF5691 domain-containing protein [Hymenobacter saemangeumensis]|uniref:DUF5691 domain-containing protein n=1 Tax=Hymenobacter saemangeumensis TaxID=1084522 RepID=A0ABP8IM26_9BACT